jgi:AcrR family transcriptional regulator
MTTTTSAAAPGATGSRREARREQTRAEVLTAAWTLVRSQGLAGLSMRDLGEAVGMRAQSVYSYYPSKDAIYDAMFRQGYEEFRAWISADAGIRALPPVERFRHMAHRFMDFGTTDPVRYQLLFQRTIPGFEPSPASYAVALDVLDALAVEFAAVGISDPAAVDLATAVFTGLTSQQLANDPGGDRWERLVDRAVAMLLADLAPHLLSDPDPDTRTGGTT